MILFCFQSNAQAPYLEYLEALAGFYFIFFLFIFFFFILFFIQKIFLKYYFHY